MTETYYTESGRAVEDEAGDWTDRDAIRRCWKQLLSRTGDIQQEGLQARLAGSFCVFGIALRWYLAFHFTQKI